MKLARHQHAIKRASKRMGITLTRRKIQAIIAKIDAKQGVLVRSQRDGRECWVVTLDGRAIKCIWAPKERVIVTVMERPEYNAKHRRRG